MSPQSPIRKKAIVPFSRWNKLRCTVHCLRSCLASHETQRVLKFGLPGGREHARQGSVLSTASHMLLGADAQALTIELKIG